MAQTKDGRTVLFVKDINRDIYRKEVEVPVTITSNRRDAFNKRICEEAAKKMSERKPVHLSARGGAATSNPTEGSISERAAEGQGEHFNIVGRRGLERALGYVWPSNGSPVLTEEKLRLIDEKVKSAWDKTYAAVSGGREDRRGLILTRKDFVSASYRRMRLRCGRNCGVEGRR